MIQGLRVSALVQLDEVRSYFSGKPFEGRWEGDSYDGSVSTVDLKIRTTGRTYEVKMESVDDPDDADEVSTGEPLKAIAEFLGRDIPGGEHFEKMSSVPAFFAHSVAMAAELVGAGAVGRAAAIRMLRRMSSWRPTADSVPSRPGVDLSDLEKDARKKGWKARLKKDLTGDDVLEIDVSGIYRATVALGSIVYSYDYTVRGEDEVRESGTTDDPIREYEKWAQQDDVRAAFKRSRSKRQEQKHEEMGKTRPAGGASVDPRPGRISTAVSNPGTPRGKTSIEDSGFADVEVHHAEVHDLLDLMKARIRRTSHLERATASDFAEVSRLARMCFLLASVPAGEDGRIQRMSLEDVETAYVLPHGSRTAGFLESLNEVRGRARSSSAVDPDMADRAGKSVYEVMET